MYNTAEKGVKNQMDNLIGLISVQKLKIPFKECGQIFHGKWVLRLFPRKETRDYY